MTVMTIKQQLGHLKGFTVRFGSIHEAQAIQLRNYPLTLSDSIKKAETKLDPKLHIISYHCSSKNGKFKKTKKANVAFQNIVVWIRTIIWDDTEVEVFVDGKMIYDSRSK